MASSTQVDTVDGVRDLAARLIGSDLVVVPIRHHSPGGSRAVQQAFTRHKPSAVLIEGPHGFTPLLEQLTHPEARFPLAIYAWLREARKRGEPVVGRGAYFPFCDHSPELIAAQLAAAAGVPAAFCDLDFADQVAAERAAAGAGAEDSGGVSADDDHEDGVENAEAGRSAPPAAESLQDETHFDHSRRLAELAHRAGCRDHEDLWEKWFEAEALDLDEYTARMTAYCLLARRDATAAALAAEGTTAREAEMLHHIRSALNARAAGDGPVLVVLGGFHAVAIPDLLAAGRNGPRRPRFPKRKVEAGAALIRYDFVRLDRLAGYASGMTSPRWHAQLWTAEQSGTPVPQARREVALSTLIDIGDRMRDSRVPVSTPALSAAMEQCLRLADLRGHIAPLRSDLIDAVTSCLIQGDADTDGARVRAITRAQLCGSEMGELPPGASTPPLIEDVMGRLAALRLPLTEQRNVALDVWRTPAHRATSRLLHGLEWLDVPYGHRTAGPDFAGGVDLGRIQERWACLWTPMCEGALAEASRFGSTLPEAVGNAFTQACETADRRAPTAAIRLLSSALVLGLHDQAPTLIEQVRAAIAAEPAFDVAAAATGQLALIAEGREPLEATRLAGMNSLVAEAYRRAVFLGRDLQGEQCDPELVTGALARLRELLVSPAGAELDPEPFWAIVDRLATDHDVALVRGAAAGLAYTAGRLDADDLGRSVAGHLTSSLPARDSVAYLRGLLSTARVVCWHGSGDDAESADGARLGVVDALDRLMVGWDEETFLERLPDLRLAFAELTPAETDRVSSLAAGLHGTATLGRLQHAQLDQVTALEHDRIGRAVARILVADGLGAWA